VFKDEESGVVLDAFEMYDLTVAEEARGTNSSDVVA
jgi:hypothetical protein